MAASRAPAPTSAAGAGRQGSYWPGRAEEGAVRQTRGYSPLLSRGRREKATQGPEELCPVPAALECPGLGRAAWSSSHRPRPRAAPSMPPTLVPPQLLRVPLSLRPPLQGPGDPCLPAPRRPGPQLQAQRGLGLGQLVEPGHAVLSGHRAPVHLQDLVSRLQPRPGSRAPWRHLEAGETRLREPVGMRGRSGPGRQPRRCAGREGPGAPVTWAMERRGPLAT